MDTRFQHLAHRNCHVNSPRGLGLKPAAVPPHEPAPKGTISARPAPWLRRLAIRHVQNARAVSLSPRCRPATGHYGIWMST
ncbi:hypothetical protein C7S15_2793 [Burkholderia cepacia]|nr:hypothetical protein [Burkholderia cepacia]